MPVRVIQAAHGYGNTGATPIALSNPVRKGRMLCITALHTYLGCPPSPSDNFGNQYTLWANPLPAGASYRLWVWTTIIKAGGPLTVTVSMACGSLYNYSVCEVTGVDKHSPFALAQFGTDGAYATTHYCAPVQVPIDQSLIVGVLDTGHGSIPTTSLTPGGVLLVENSLGNFWPSMLVTPTLSRGAVTPTFGTDTRVIAGGYSVVFRAAKPVPKKSVLASPYTRILTPQSDVSNNGWVAG